MPHLTFFCNPFLFTIKKVMWETYPSIFLKETTQSHVEFYKASTLFSVLKKLEENSLSLLTLSVSSVTK